MNIEETERNPRREKTGARIPKCYLTHITVSYLNYACMGQNHNSSEKKKNQTLIGGGILKVAILNI